jgi:hypothetical protein
MTGRGQGGEALDIRDKRSEEGAMGEEEGLIAALITVGQLTE